MSVEKFVERVPNGGNHRLIEAEQMHSKFLEERPLMKLANGADRQRIRELMAGEWVELREVWQDGRDPGRLRSEAADVAVFGLTLARFWEDLPERDRNQLVSNFGRLVEFAEMNEFVLGDEVGEVVSGKNQANYPKEVFVWNEDAGVEPVAWFEYVVKSLRDLRKEHGEPLEDLNSFEAGRELLSQVDLVMGGNERRQ